GEVVHLSVSADGRRALSAGGDTFVWEPATGRIVQKLTPFGFNYIILSGDGRYAFVARHDQTVEVWDVDAGKVVRTFPKDAGLNGPFAASADGRSILATLQEETVVWIDAASAKELGRYKGHQGNINALAFAPDGRRALSLGNDLTVRLWDLGAAAEGGGIAAATPPGEPKPAGEMKPAGAPPTKRELRLWDLKSSIVRGGISKDGRRALVGAGNKLVLLDLDGKQEFKPLLDHNGGGVNGVVISP